MGPSAMRTRRRDDFMMDASLRRRPDAGAAYLRGNNHSGGVRAILVEKPVRNYRINSQ